MDWTLRRAMEKKIGRRVNVKGKDLTPETRLSPRAARDDSRDVRGRN